MVLCLFTSVVVFVLQAHITCVDKKTSVYNAKKFSWPGFDIISFGYAYDHTLYFKSVACTFLASPFYSWAVFAWVIYIGRESF